MIFEVQQEDIDINIGSFEVPESMDENSVGDFVYKKSIYNISIRTREREGIPHFHVEGNGKLIAIFLYDNMYFTHGNYKNVFKDRECPYFNKWLSDICICKDAKGLSNWEYMVKHWCIAKNQQPLCNVQPDYSYIKPYQTR